MVFLQGIREKTGSFVLKRKVKGLSRERQFINLSDAVKVGILFQQTDNQSFESVRLFIRSLESEGKSIYALGYVDSGKIPDFYLLRKGYNFFCREDLNWYYRPDGPAVNDFLIKEFDLVINLCIDSFFPVEYIYALSKAKFRAGRFIGGSEYSDLSIDIKESRDMNYFIGQIIHYLRMINSKQQ